MLRFIFLLALFSQLLPKSYAECCKNYAAYCFTAGDCTPNCNDGVSLCDCPGACLNNNLGGCDTSYDCTVQVVESDIVEDSSPTSTSVFYYSTSTHYYSTYTAIKVVTEQSTDIVTSTIYQTITSTAYVTVTGPQVTVTGQALMDRDSFHEVKFGRYFRHARQNYVTSTTTVTAAGNFCDQPGEDPCVAIDSEVYVQSEVYTTTMQSTYYQNVPSTMYTTVESTEVVTNTYTEPGNTVTMAAATSSIVAPTTASSPAAASTTASTTAATASSSTSFSADNNDNPTSAAPATVIVTAAPSHGKGAIARPNAEGFLGICNLVLWQFWIHVM